MASRFAEIGFKDWTIWKANNPEWAKKFDELTRLPWHKGFIAKIRKAILDARGEFGDDLQSLAMETYIDSCVCSDEYIKEQVAARKLLVRLRRMLEGDPDEYNTQYFLGSVYSHTRNRPLTYKQLQAVQRIAKRYHSKLTSYPLAEDEFDGWEEVAKKTT